MTQGVALGWHGTRPLALDTSASQPLFGYQPVFNLSWYQTCRGKSGSIMSLALCLLYMGVSSLMNDIELVCLLLPRGKG